MKAVLKAVILIPLTIVIVAFAVANRAPVQMSFDPFGGNASEIGFAAPLFLLLFAAALIGAIAGGVGAWLSQRHWRRSARRQARELADLREEFERQRVTSSEANAVAVSMIR
jgi:uncharacterized integral membrane protein